MKNIANSLPAIATKLRISKARPRYFYGKISVHNVLAATKVIPIPIPSINKFTKK